MEDSYIILIWIFIILLFGIAYWYATIPANLPPGPIGYPLIGSLLSISKHPYLTMNRMAKKYGNVFSLYVGNSLVIVLNDFEAIKEAFVKQADTFSGRNDDELIDIHKIRRQGVVSSDGEYWRQHRRFILHNLRDSGVGKLTLEPKLLNEIQFFLAELKNNTGKSYNIQPLLNYSLINNVIVLIKGQRFSYDDRLLKDYVKLLSEYVTSFETIPLHSIFPWIKYISGITSHQYVKTKQIRLQKQSNLIQEIVEFGENPNDNATDDSYVQAYLNERRKRLEINKNEDIFTTIGLFLNSRELINAGGETSSTTLIWGLLYMTFYPEIQKKVQREIDEVIGRDREPSYTDRLNTPYTEATLLEIQRMVTLLPLSLPHRTTKDTTLYGFHIPKDTMILPNLYAVHHDPQLWGDPHNFRPERFIGEDGKLNKPEYLIPFSIGKRACAGEPLAKTELFLYFVSIMQHFDVVPTQDIKQSLEAVHAIVRQPQCTTVCLKSR